MEPFTTHRGQVVPLDRANVDTDQIIPKQFLKSIKRTGFGENLFDAWRFNDEGEMGKTPNEREINHDFVLNDPRYQEVSILLARRNFGCGSSREHAVWALQQFGFRCVIAPSFADIFFNNCFKNGLLPIVLDEKIVDSLFELALGDAVLTLEIDLAAQTIQGPIFDLVKFEIDARRKEPLLHGLDDIGLTLAHIGEIQQFEAGHKRRMPWVFSQDRDSGDGSSRDV